MSFCKVLKVPNVPKVPGVLWRNARPIQNVVLVIPLRPAFDMTKRRWLMASGVVVLVALAVLARPLAMWWGGRSPADEANRVAALAGVGPGQVVAEIGAGAGEMARVLAQRVLPGGRLIATELSEDRLAGLRAMVSDERWPHVEVRTGEAAGTALPAECCALIYMRHVFHHFDNPAVMSRALYDAAANGGRLVVIDFPPQWLLGLIAPVTREGAGGGGHGITADQLMNHLTNARFIIERHDAGWTTGSFMVMARK
jgi:SAM-dependent methyltransferase